MRLWFLGNYQRRIFSGRVCDDRKITDSVYWFASLIYDSAFLLLRPFRPQLLRLCFFLFFLFSFRSASPNPYQNSSALISLGRLDPGGLGRSCTTATPGAVPPRSALRRRSLSSHSLPLCFFWKVRSVKCIVDLFCSVKCIVEKFLEFFLMVR